MKTIEQQIEVMKHFANGGEVERRYVYGTGWAQVSPTNEFDWACFEYRIKEVADPYAELKAAAKDPTKQIRRIGSERGWVSPDEPGKWTWHYPPDRYEIRDKPRTVKLLAWLRADGHLTWRNAERPLLPSNDWKRVPSEDKTIEVKS